MKENNKTKTWNRERWEIKKEREKRGMFLLGIC